MSKPTVKNAILNAIKQIDIATVAAMKSNCTAEKQCVTRLKEAGLKLNYLKIVNPIFNTEN